MERPKDLIPYTRREQGDKIIVTWSAMKNKTRGEPYPVRERGGAAATFEGKFGQFDSIIVRGSNTGEGYHALLSKIAAGAASLKAVPAFLQPEAYGDDDMLVTVSIAFDRAS